MDGTAPFCGAWGTHTRFGRYSNPFSVRPGWEDRHRPGIAIARAQRAFRLSLGVERGSLSLSLLFLYPEAGLRAAGDHTVFAPFQGPL